MDFKQRGVGLEGMLQHQLAFHQMVALQVDVEPQLGGLRRVVGGVGLDAEDMRLEIIRGRYRQAVQQRTIVEVHIVQLDGLAVLHQ